MRLDNVIKFFMPKEERFHALLERDTQHLMVAAGLFAEIAHSASLEERRIKVVQLKAAEHKGDAITREIFEALNSTFITPLDREDIRGLAKNIDDILDFLEGVAQYLIVFELSESPEALRQFAGILVSMTGQVDRATGMVWDLANEKQIQQALVRISELENQADTLYDTVIAGLFRDRRDPIEILKWKEVYDGLEDACDQCKDFTHVLGNIVIKNA